MIALVKYNAGNIASVQNALNRLGAESILTDDPNLIRTADKVIFPGVGEAGTAMNYLKQQRLDEVILSLNKPFLGICLGLQLMCKSSEEGNTSCLGIFDTQVRCFPPQDKVPHMGWNNCINQKGPLFGGIETTDDMYYVHSFYAEPCLQTVATCDYILPFSAALQQDNYYAVQFHPEKSGTVGQQMLQNFLNL
ncbi:MAG: imidazole glycerol phosphate synthase subunit HisH [Flavobacteriales bacterium]|nr:imidazole glycerol phosphate synthase subunit HisH [Flavobacteriales bacterium]